MTTYYKINGQYVTYQQAHDLGYTMEATADQDYKSAGSNNWGEWLNSGFYDGLDGDLVSGSFFIEGETGWVNINVLALRGYFPNEAETLTMHNVNDGRESAAAKLESGGEYYYLVQADLNLGWISEDDLPETGWQEGSGSVAFCGNFTTEDDVMSNDVAGGQGYLPTYLVVTPLYELRGWNAGGNLNMAYFTSAGASATQNTELDYYESYRLYDENGNAITYRAINEKYRITSAFRINKGSNAALWNQSDLNTWLKLQQVGQMFAYTEDEADMPSDTDIYFLMYSISPSITVLLGLRFDGNDWLSKTFDTDDFWWSGILSEEDKTLIESIGLRTSVMFYGYGGPIGSIEYNAGYDYKILGLYSDINGTQEVQTDLSNLFVAPHTPTGDSTQYAAICNHTAITTPAMTWKVKITKN